MTRIVAVALFVAGAATLALAQLPAPEIDPSSGVTALALLGGALLVIRSTRRR
jgi:hypothetical protein